MAHRGTETRVPCPASPKLSNASPVVFLQSVVGTSSMFSRQLLLLHFPGHESIALPGASHACKFRRLALPPPHVGACSRNASRQGPCGPSRRIPPRRRIRQLSVCCAPPVPSRLPSDVSVHGTLPSCPYVSPSAAVSFLFFLFLPAPISGTRPSVVPHLGRPTQIALRNDGGTLVRRRRQRNNLVGPSDLRSPLYTVVPTEPACYCR